MCLRIRAWYSAALLVICVAAFGCADTVGDGELDENPEQQDGDDVAVADGDLNLTATDGDHEEFVVLEWSEIEGAVEYQIYRDQDHIATVDTVGYEDTGADEGGMPQAPEAFDVSQGAFLDRVELTWEKPEVLDGEVHNYELVAIDENDESVVSSADEGYRSGYSVEFYEVEIDGEWNEIGGQTGYSDISADMPAVDFGGISASTGDYVDHVLLEVDGVDIEAGTPSSYRVRAVNDSGTGEASEYQEGYAGVGDFGLQWQRSTGETAEDFVAIDGATTETYEDTDAPSDASLRYYRLAVDFERQTSKGIDNASEAVPGFRLAPVDWFDRDELAYYAGDTGQASLVEEPRKNGDRALETDGNNEVIVSYDGDGLDHYPGPGDDFYVWIRSDFSETSFEGPHIYWGPGEGGEERPRFQTRIRQGDIYLRGPGDCEDENEESLDKDTWYRLEIRTTEEGDVDKEVYDTDGELVYGMSISCDLTDLDAAPGQVGIGFRAGGMGTTWYDHWTMTQLDY